MKSKEIKKNKREEVKKWVEGKISFISTECDLQIEKNKNILENLLNIKEKLNNLSGIQLTEQTKTWLRERIKFIKKNVKENDKNAIETLEYFRYIQNL